jgi:pantoate--beta-alanine ligase
MVDLSPDRSDARHWQRFIRGAPSVQIVRSREELAQALGRLEQSGTVALVPTMGALHRGHMELIAEARRRAKHVVATIFVNPLQFGEGEDFTRYPRQERLDFAMLEAAQVELTWVPRIEDIYPNGFATTISVAGVSERWEGEARPGHFDGVATVVAKLLLAIRPDTAIFGEKDFQQLAVIRRMVADLALSIKIVGVPTVREDDGLALSSRNAYLSADERRRAVALPRALAAACQAIARGDAVGSALAEGVDQLAGAGFSPVHYFALVDAVSLEPLQRPAGEMRLIAAARMGPTRLIDNLAV